MFRKSFFRTTRLCVGGECAPLLQGQGKHMFIQSNDCTTSESFASRVSHGSHWIGLFKSYQTLLSALISDTASIRISLNIWRHSKLQQTAGSRTSAQWQCFTSESLLEGRQGRRTSPSLFVTLTVSITWSQEEMHACAQGLMISNTNQALTALKGSGNCDWGAQLWFK